MADGASAGVNPSTTSITAPIETLQQTGVEFLRMFYESAEWDVPTSIVREDVYSDPAGYFYYKMLYSTSQPVSKAPGEEAEYSGLAYKSATYKEDKYSYGKELTIEALNMTPEDLPSEIAAEAMRQLDYHKYNIIMKSIVENSVATGAGPNLSGGLTAPGGVALFSASTSEFHVGKDTGDGAQYDGNHYTGGYALTAAGLRTMLLENMRGFAEEKLPNGLYCWGRELTKPTINYIGNVKYKPIFDGWLAESLVSWSTLAAGNVTVSNNLPKEKYVVNFMQYPFLDAPYTYAFLGDRGNRQAPIFLRYRQMSTGMAGERSEVVEKDNGNKAAVRIYVPTQNSDTFRHREAWDYTLFWNIAGHAGDAHGTGRNTMAS